MRTYIKKFFCNADGVETIEWLAVVLIAAILIGIAAGVGSTVQDRLSSIGEYL